MQLLYFKKIINMFNLLKHFFLFEKYIKIKVFIIFMDRCIDLSFRRREEEFPFFFFFFFMPSLPPEAENQPKKNAKEACN